MSQDDDDSRDVCSHCHAPRGMGLQLGKILHTLGKIETGQEQTAALAQRHERIIEGNGQPGLKANVIELMRFIGNLRRLQWIVVGAVVVEVVGGIGVVLTYLITRAAHRG